MESLVHMNSNTIGSVLFQDIFVFVMYHLYVTSGPSILTDSTDSMIHTYMLCCRKLYWLGPDKIMMAFFEHYRYPEAFSTGAAEGSEKWCGKHAWCSK